MAFAIMLMSNLQYKCSIHKSLFLSAIKTMKCSSVMLTFIINIFDCINNAIKLLSTPTYSISTKYWN